MKWDDVGKIMSGGIPNTLPLTSVDEFDLPVCLQDDLRFCSQHVAHLTEMEATIRVFSLMKAAVDGTDVMIKLQPSVPNFTDLSIVTIDSGTYLSLIEVKKPDISTTLKHTGLVTAQVLREVHVVLSADPNLRTLPFVLTNSQVLSFGLAERKPGNMFIVSKQFTSYVDPEMYDGRMRKLFHCLKCVVRGKWIDHKFQSETSTTVQEVN